MSCSFSVCVSFSLAHSLLLSFPPSVSLGLLPPLHLPHPLSGSTHRSLCTPSVTPIGPSFLTTPRSPTPHSLSLSLYFPSNLKSTWFHHLWLEAWFRSVCDPAHPRQSHGVGAFRYTTVMWPSAHRLVRARPTNCFTNFGM